MIVGSSPNAFSSHLNQDLHSLVFGEPPATLGDIIPQEFLDQSEFAFYEFLNAAGIADVADDAMYLQTALAPQTPVIPGVDLPPAPELPVISPSSPIGTFTRKDGGATLFFSPSSSSLATALGSTPDPPTVQTAIDLQQWVLANPQQVPSPPPFHAASQYHGGYPQTYSNGTTPGYERPSSVQSRTSFASTPGILTPPIYAPAPSIRLASTDTTFPDYSDFLTSYPALYSSPVGHMDGVGYYQDPFAQQQMAPTIATPKVLLQQVHDTHIYTPPARPSGVVRRKRHDRTSAVSPYPDAFDRRANSSDAYALGSAIQEFPWMGSLQRNQCQSGEFIPDYGSLGDPASQQTTSGGITENLADAKTHNKFKGSKATQQQLDKKAHDRRRRGAISAVIEDLGQKIPQRPRTGDHCQLDTLGDVLYALNIPIPARITGLPPTDCKNRPPRGIAEAVRRQNVKAHINALASGLGLDTTVQLHVLQKTLEIVEGRINAGLLVSTTC